MGMALAGSGTNTAPPDWLQVYDTAGGFTNAPVDSPRTAPKPKRRKRAKARQKSVDHLYADLIKAGIVRIERKKGQPPKIVWL